jgi:hypothetical protein
MNFTAEDLKWFVPKMMLGVRLTKKKKVEHGFVVCKVDDQLKASDMCVGEKCSVNIPQCQWPDTFMEFHTHPQSGIILPSTHDVYGSLASDTDFICMGTPRKEGIIRCYGLKQKILSMDDSARKFIEAYKEGDVMSQLRAMDHIIEQVGEWKGFIKSGGL